MGPLEIVDHKNDSAIYINFADVPISVKYMDEWLTTKLLKKDQAFYPLTQFLKDLFNDLIRQFLNNDSCYMRNLSLGMQPYSLGKDSLQLTVFWKYHLYTKKRAQT